LERTVTVSEKNTHIAGASVCDRQIRVAVGVKVSRNNGPGSAVGLIRDWLPKRSGPRRSSKVEEKEDKKCNPDEQT
jgi:hypothetical protein